MQLPPILWRRPVRSRATAYSGGVIPALDVNDVVKTYGGRRAVDGVSFAAQPGEITAILGPNGAGKTTTLECAEGLRAPDSGSIRVLGRERVGASPADDQWLRERVGVMVQGGGLPMSPTGRQVLTHVARLYSDPAPLPTLTERLALTDVLDSPVRRLSGGERQRLAVACALLGRPELAFLDEPSSGVDPHARRDTWDLLREQREAGTAVVLTTHHLEEAEELADHVVIVNEGRVVASGTVDELASGYTLTITGLQQPGQVSLLLPGARVTGSAATALVPTNDVAFLAHLTSELGLRGEQDAHLTISRRTLESVFLEKTRRTALTMEDA